MGEDEEADGSSEGGTGWASQSQEATGTAGSGEELLCWPQALPQAETQQAAEPRAGGPGWQWGSCQRGSAHCPQPSSHSSVQATEPQKAAATGHSLSRHRPGPLGPAQSLPASHSGTATPSAHPALTRAVLPALWAPEPVLQRALPPEQLFKAPQGHEQPPASSCKDKQLPQPAAAEPSWHGHPAALSPFW